MGKRRIDIRQKMRCGSTSFFDIMELYEKYVKIAEIFMILAIFCCILAPNALYSIMYNYKNRITLNKTKNFFKKYEPF